MIRCLSSDLSRSAPQRRSCCLRPQNDEGGVEALAKRARQAGRAEGAIAEAGQKFRFLRSSSGGTIMASGRIVPEKWKERSL